MDAAGRSEAAGRLKIAALTDGSARVCALVLSATLAVLPLSAAADASCSAAASRPSHITVLGASKGAVIAMLASTRLRSRDLRFVLMANCNDWVLDRFAIDLWGDVLSIYDSADEIGQSCRKFFDRATGLGRNEEIRLTLGIGHAILYQPLEEWVPPTFG